MAGCCIGFRMQRARISWFRADLPALAEAIKELPANSTAGQLHEVLQLQRAALQTNGPASYLMVRPGPSCGCHVLSSSLW